MRISLCLCTLPWPALAWTFSPVPICTMEQIRGKSTIQVTFDPDSQIYSLHIDRAAGWRAFPVFVLQFNGPVPLTISTTRHRIEGTRLTVTDRGFGNVLAGLESNQTATAILGQTSLAIDLSKAAAKVEAFRACPSRPSV
ncbi:hypothetical protein [Jannaschia faecimaris]|uniref:hypothetical protein n=1 Tax=Jannaschia faecimaris TaxID=1244108 RepID=UPI001B8B7CD4|nr:hypothetical protein [Jannaschia faecimaris]